MVPAPVTLRCPQCGQFLVAPAPPFATAAWVACPHCAGPVPVVAPRDPPPLFSWEVFPHLYPTVVASRPPGRATVRLVLALLVSAAVLLAGLAGALALVGSAALTPGTFTVEGVVQKAAATGVTGFPIAGAVVNLTAENHQVLSELTGADGYFRFAGVHPGGVTLNVTASGYFSSVVTLFASASYATPGANGQSVRVDLVPSNGSTKASAVTHAPAFSDLETYVASDFSAAILLGIGAVVAGAGAWTARRDRHLAMGTAGGSAAVLAPVVLFLLGIATAFPVAGLFGALTIGIGATAAGLDAARMAARGPVPDPE